MVVALVTVVAVVAVAKADVDDVDTDLTPKSEESCQVILMPASSVLMLRLSRMSLSTESVIEHSLSMWAPLFTNPFEKAAMRLLTFPRDFVAQLSSSCNDCDNGVDA